MLDFRRIVAQELLTLARLPRAGRPALTTAPTKIHKRSIEYSIERFVPLQNRGAHRAVYVTERGRCDACSKDKIPSNPHSKLSICNIFLCCNEKNNCFLEVR